NKNIEWYKSAWFFWLVLIFMPPAGLVLMFSFKHYEDRKGIRKGAMIYCLAILIAAGIQAILEFVNRFTLKKHYKEERQGFNPSTEEIMTIPGRFTLKLVVGKLLFEKLNALCEEPTVRAKPLKIKRVGRFKPKLNLRRTTFADY
ncbi:MAG: HU family DNA-binding protein, partial [Defluviitaleaceae bacterium]|nr:HU family DNA-binding protein [Defluviitaleaceae bacterium]